MIYISVPTIEGDRKHDNLAMMPMTSTGFVRRDFRAAMNRNRRNREMFLNTRLTPELYQMLKKAFRGGDTHAVQDWM